MNLIEANFTSAFRSQIAQMIKQYGVQRIELAMLNDGHHVSFVKALVKSIIKKEGW